MSRYREFINPETGAYEPECYVCGEKCTEGYSERHEHDSDGSYSETNYLHPECEEKY